MNRSHLSRPSVKVLVVDDDPIVLEVCRERLSSLGCEVAVRDQALGTSRTITQWQPDIVLLDVMMPALNGAELAKLLKKGGASQRTHIVLHSSKPPAELSSILAQTGALGAIAKTADDSAFTDQFRSLAKRAGLVA